jgi:uncharacterized phiE125 gp8 family phage protein
MEVAARDKAEAFLRRPLLPQTVNLWWDNGVEDTVSFPFGKLNTVESITTYASDGTPTVTSTDDYVVDPTNDQEGRIHFIQAQYGYRTINDVAIQIINGYADAASVPQLIKEGILSLISYWYENREMYGSSSLSMGVKNKLNSYRVLRV